MLTPAVQEGARALSSCTQQALTKCNISLTERTRKREGQFCVSDKSSRSGPFSKRVVGRGARTARWGAPRLCEWREHNPRTEHVAGTGPPKPPLVRGRRAVPLSA